MNSFIIILFIFLGIIFYIIQNSGYENKIQEKIGSIGGEVLNIERRNFLTGIGPFMVVGKGRTIFYIEYRVDDELREGWVRFGGLFGPDWRL